MVRFSKKHFPLTFLLIITGFWTFYYQSTNALNDYGQAKPEWLLLIDGLIVLPLLCFMCIQDRKEAMVKALAYCCLIVLLGSYIIPESSKFIWPYLESGRYVAVTAFILLEITTILTVFLAVKASLSKHVDPDLAISQPIEKILGRGAISDLLSFEARVWTYALFSKKVNRNHFAGEQHFTCHKKDGAQSNQLGFILIILFELPIMHIVLHFIWSPFAANITTGLTLVGLVFFIAEYKALAIRPISIINKNLIIRYGVWNPLTIDFHDIVSVQTNSEFIARASHIKRFNLSGHPNVALKLSSGQCIYIGLDSPTEFINTVNKRME